VRFLISYAAAIAIGAAVATGAAAVLADDEPPALVSGRGFIGYVQMQPNGWGYFRVFEPEPGIHCYTYNQAPNALSCVRVVP